jgi:hypothetical protein
MRRFFPFLVLACLVVPIGSVHAQITVQRSDIQNIFYVGDTLNVRTITDTAVNVGQVGGPNVYDFSSLNLIVAGSSPVVLGSSLPNAMGRFANDTMFVQPNEEQAFSFTNQGMYDIGKVKIANDSTLDYIYRSPWESLFRFPVTFGSGYTETITTTDSTFVHGVLSAAGSNQIGWVGAVDGYGTLKLPGGSSYQCLRVMKFENPPCSTCNDDKDINFITQNGLVVIVNTNHTQPDTGRIQIVGFQIIQGKLVTGVERPTLAPTSFVLEQNYPNPFNPSTEISYTVPSRTHVTLTVFNVLGIKVANLVNGEKEAGNYNVLFDANNLASGIYFYRLQAGNFLQTKKMVLLK